MVWHEPYHGGTVGIAIAIDVAEVEQSYRAQLARIVESCDEDGLSKPVEAVLVRGSASSGLLSAATDADLLVVGSRGHGGFVGLLLGSVSHQVAAHASCPVVVVPAAASS